MKSFNLSNFNSISYSTFFHCTYLFVLYFDYLNRTLVARTPRYAISEKYHFRKCIMIFTRTFLKIVLNKSIVIITKIFLNNFASLLLPIRYIFSLYWIRSSRNLLSWGMQPKLIDGFVIYVENLLGWRKLAELYIKFSSWRPIKLSQPGLNAQCQLSPCENDNWQLNFFQLICLQKKKCDKFAKICRRTYPFISQLVATPSTLPNSNFTIHSGIQNNICHIIRHTWLLLVWKWVLTLQKIS